MSLYKDITASDGEEYRIIVDLYKSAMPSIGLEIEHQVKIYNKAFSEEAGLLHTIIITDTADLATIVTNLTALKGKTTLTDELKVAGYTEI